MDEDRSTYFAEGARWVWGPVATLALVVGLLSRHEPLGIDFHTYEAAARVGLTHGWAHLYDQRLVAAAQRHLAPLRWTQPFLSPPPAAWLATPLLALPYGLAVEVWRAATLAVLAGALAWSTDYRGVARVIAVGAALAPWWVMEAIQVGQIVPLVAASVLVGWRLLRQNRDVAAGIVLALVLLKPNTAILAPVAILVAGRLTAFAAWVGSALVMAAVSLATTGPAAMAQYLAGFGHLPSGADQLTLHGTFGAAGMVAIGLRALIVVTALLTCHRLRHAPGLALGVGVLCSLLVTPYLHASDLCLLVAAAWTLWHEHAGWRWRAGLTALWLLATPLLAVAALGPPLNRWLLLELTVMIAVVGTAWAGAFRQGGPPLGP